MIKIRLQRLTRRLRLAIALGSAGLVLLLWGQLMQALGWQMLPPEALGRSANGLPDEDLVRSVWAAVWPMLTSWAGLLSPPTGAQLPAEVSQADGLSGWYVLLPLILIALVLSLAQLLRLLSEISILGQQQRIQAEPVANLPPPPALHIVPLFDALDEAEAQMAGMQAELDQLRVALINASLPEPLDDADEPLERARLACDRVQDQVRGLRAQHQVVQARAMGFRA